MVLAWRPGETKVDTFEFSRLRCVGGGDAMILAVVPALTSLVLAATLHAAVPPPPPLDLDGEWEFETDPDRVRDQCFVENK
jgi:hypothetical protein